MNVNLDSQFSTKAAANTDNITTTYQPPSRTQTAWDNGYSLDIADKVMDNEAYQGHGLTAEDIMQQADNMNVDIQKDFMVVMSSCVSGEDLQKMQEEGFNPASTDVETYVSIVDEIKVTLAKAGVEIKGYNDDLDAKTVEEITGSRVQANELSRDIPALLEENDLPVTKENVSAVEDAVAQALGIGELSEDAVKYMVTNQKQPTIENLYKAQFSSTSDMRQAQGYYSEGSGNYGKYYAKKAQDINWDNLKSRIESVVKQAGLDTDEQTKAQAVEDAKWLVEAGIELNSKNLTLVSELKNLQLPMTQDKLVEFCVNALGNGKEPTDALMTGEMSAARQAQAVIDMVDSISDGAIHKAVESDEELNIRNLAAAQEQLDGYQTDNAEPSLKEIEARRQLEEIRLMMSVDANRHLIKSGISIDTTALSQLVDELKAAEQSIRAALFRGETPEENNRMALIYEETLTKTKELGGMPAALVGKIAVSSKPYTIAALHSEGKEFQNDQQRHAASSYETLMTAPRKDLGDSISKAFRNVDDILEDMGIETSDANRRAVRILGYNTMEINEENIKAVKEADSKVCGVIRRMTPAVTLHMIRDRKNPLEMTMEELDEYLNGQDRDPASDAERFSKFLQRLDRSNAITDDEREAYIGIYRMFRQIEKTDGAVIGSLVATGAEMNFKNMLSAVRTKARAGKNMDFQIDDGFGGLETLISKGKAIDAQIMAGFESGADNGRHNEAEERYYARLSGEINDELANRTDLDKLKMADITADTTIEGFADDLKTMQLPQNSQEFYEQRKQELDDFQNNLNDARKADDEIIQTLMDYGQAVSVDNIQAASMLIMERGSLFRQIFSAPQADDDQSDDGADDEENPSDGFIESLTDKESAVKGYEELIDEAGKAVENLVNKDGVSQIDLKAAKMLYKGLALAGSFAREENYEVPVNIKGEITSVNLKIYHNAAKAGKVSITLDSDKLGKVAADFDVKQGKILGMIVFDNRQEENELEQIKKAVTDELSDGKDRQIQINLVHSDSVDLNKFGKDKDTEAADGHRTSTAELYKTAKAFIAAIKSL